MEMSDALLALVVMLCVFFAAMTIWAVAATVGDLVDRWAVAKMEELKKENERLKKSLGEKEKENERLKKSLGEKEKENEDDKSV